MILRSICLENVRRFTEPVEVRGIAPGLNVLTAPNEHGKSTIFDALHAVFFRDRNSWDKRIQSLQPYAGGWPKVEVEIELDGEVYRISKLWKRGRSGSVRVFVQERLFKQADEAEEWISEVLQAPEAGGPAGLLWVRQGQTGLIQQDKKGREGAHRARRDLVSSVSSEVDAMTGGHRMDDARKRCAEDLLKYVTPKGHVKKDGLLAIQRNAVGALRESHRELGAVSDRLQEALQRRRRLRRELADLDNPREQTARRERLQAEQAAHSKAQSHQTQLERAREKEQSKQVEVEGASERLDTLVKAVKEFTNARESHAAAEREAAAATKRLAREAEVLERADSVRKTEREKTAAAEEALLRALQKDGVAARRARREELAEKLRQAEEARRALEEAHAEGKRELSMHASDGLERLAAQVRALQRQRDREAAAITMVYQPDREGGVSMGGIALQDGVRALIPEGAELDIAGMGRLSVHPDQRVDNTSLEEAEQRLRDELLRHGVEDMNGVHASLARRRAAEERRLDAEVSLKAAAPRGVPALRAELAALPDAEEDVAEALPLDEANARAEAVRKALKAAVEEHERRSRVHTEAQKHAVRGDAALEGAVSRLDRARKALADMPSPEAEVVRRKEAYQRLCQEQRGLERDRREIDRTAPNMQEVAARLQRAHSIVQSADKETERLRLELGKLDTLIEVQDGAAVEEKLADAVERLAARESELEVMEHELAVLQRLKRALDTAQESARDRYVAPVLRELVPLIRLLWPAAEIRFDAEDVLPVALVRKGTKEDFNVLSGGTQEQIVLMVRLAFARILASGGSPAPAIFDDAIVFTDDDRIEAMFHALTRQAMDLQIIVLSCRQRAFRNLGGKILHIEPASEA